MGPALALQAVTGAIGSITAGISGSEQAKSQSQAADYNATMLRQQATQASRTAASNEAISLRKSAGDLGEQAAAFGQANIGTGGSVAAVEGQSRANAQLDALNIWYGGELERKQQMASARLEDYQSKLYQQQSKAALIGGAVGAGTALLTGGEKYGAYKTTGLPGLTAFNTGTA